MHVISESLHRQNYKFLWDLLFDRHPYGREVRGMWKGLGEKQTEVPNYEHLLELFRHTPTVLLLDEFQTWFDGLTNTKQFPWRNWASNFVQILSEIASEHPDLLVLVLSVRNGNTDAFQQIQRVGPILVDFKGPTAKEDRQKLLLHRLFENRMQVSKWQIETIVSVHVGEYLRLQRVPPAETRNRSAISLPRVGHSPHTLWSFSKTRYLWPLRPKRLEISFVSLLIFSSDELIVPSLPQLIFASMMRKVAS